MRHGSPPMLDAAMPVLAMTATKSGLLACLRLNADMIALKSNDLPVPVSAPTVNMLTRSPSDERPRTCRSREEHALPFFHDKLKHATLFLAELGDRRRLVSATGSTERNAWREKGIDLGLFGCTTERFLEVVCVFAVARFAFFGTGDGWLDRLVPSRRRRHEEGKKSQTSRQQTRVSRELIFYIIRTPENPFSCMSVIFVVGLRLRVTRK